LLRTSILDRLCGPLCDAVTQTTGSARVLEELEHSNRFVVALDARGEWYRYQQLFAELLRGELTRTEPELVPVLHRRASAWHRDVGSPSEAIHYSLAGNDVPSAAELIARHWRPFVNEGQVATVAGWLDALPENAITADAHLCVARAAVAVVLGQPEDAERFLAVAESVDDPDAQPEGGSSVGAAVATLRALEFRLAGDLGEAAEEARRAVKWEPESSPWRALSCVALGGTLYWLGETTEARTRLEEAVRAGQSQNDRHFSVVWALGHLAAISCDEEDVARAEELARRSLALAEEHGLAEHYVAAIAHITLGRVFEHRGVLDDAERHFARGLELARRFRAPAQIAYSLLAMARIRGSRGDRDGALPYLREARLILQRSADLGVVERVLTEVARDLAAPGHRPGAGRTAELTDREGHILRLLRSDLTQREIADQLYVSVNTMKTHTRSLYRKLGASSRAEALARARELGLL
jgi:LuxR family maltose regulon positive regulatory protein